MISYLPSSYLAPVSYYSYLYRHPGASFDVDSHYQKQTFRNRCCIDSPNGLLTLSIPVVKPDGNTPMKDVRISDHGNWRHQHWNALISSYRQSPFFEYYQDDFAPFFTNKWEFLADFNEELHQLVCSLMDFSPLEVTHPLVGQQFVARPYYQVFSSRHGFLPDLSIVDLLFNMGPESILYL